MARFLFAIGAFCILPYTIFILGEDIQALRQSDTEEVCGIAKRFCTWHHPRLLMALTVFGASLYALRGK